MEKKWILVKNTFNSNENECVMNVVVSKDFDFINNIIIDDSENTKNGVSVKHFCCCDYCNKNASKINDSIYEAINYWAKKSIEARKNNVDAACFIVATNLEDFEYCSDDGDEYRIIEDLLNDFSNGSDDLINRLQDRVLDPVVTPIWY